MASFTRVAVGWLWVTGPSCSSRIAWARFHGRGGVLRKSRTYKASRGLGMVGTTLFPLHFIGQSKDGPDSRVGETDFLDGEAAKSYYKG